MGFKENINSAAAHTTHYVSLSCKSMKENTHKLLHSVFWFRETPYTTSRESQLKATAPYKFDIVERKKGGAIRGIEMIRIITGIAGLALSGSTSCFLLVRIRARTGKGINVEVRGEEEVSERQT